MRTPPVVVVGGTARAGGRDDALGGPRGQGHDRDHRVRARRGRERRGVADPHAGTSCSSPRGSATEVSGSAPIRHVPIWWAENIRRPPARAGIRWTRAMNASRSSPTRQLGSACGQHEMRRAPAAACAADLLLERHRGHAQVERVGHRVPGRGHARWRRCVTAPPPWSRTQADERSAIAEVAQRSACARRPELNGTAEAARPVVYCDALDQEPVARPRCSRTR